MKPCSCAALTTRSKKSSSTTCGGRVVREADDQHLRLGPSLLDRLFEMAEESFAGGQRQTAQVAAGEHDGILMNRIGRTWAQHHIAWIDGRPGEMRQALPSRRW